MDILPFDFVRKHQVLLEPLSAQLILSPGASITAIMEVQRSLGSSPSLRWVNDEEFEQQLQKTYAGRGDSSAMVMADIREDLDLQSLAGRLEESSDLLEEDNDAPVIRLLNAIIAEALNEKASDIHVEPYQAESRVRFRLDGVLRTVVTPSVEVTPLLISRIKVMAKLDISEKRLPQDGRISVRLGGRSVDLRVSTMPSTYGERVVMRLLDKSAVQLTLDDLGLTDDSLRQLHAMIERPHGMLLVTGPTGSGKTSTLYAALQEMNSLQRNIMTVEDPVEYDLHGISQTQINARAGMSFAKGLRAILRQDPDVVLIGEIRDGETAEIAVQASLTGHLLLSTLHTNTAAGAVIRMRDLGVDSFLLASTLRGVVTQRLVRKLCEKCKQPTETDPLVLHYLSHQMLDQPTPVNMASSSVQMFKPVGCEHCNGTGYSGRQAMMEVVTITEAIQKLIHDGAGEAELEALIRERVPSLLVQGCQLAGQGITSLEEVLRVTSA